MQFLILTVFLVTGVQLVTGAAKDCYSCSLAGCNDPFNANANGVIKTPATNGWCVKGKVEKDGQTIVERASDPGVCSVNQCDKGTVQGITGTTCCCNSDLCNAGPHSVSKIGISFIASIVVLGFVARFF